jgi:hypothetical protein
MKETVSILIHRYLDSLGLSIVINWHPDSQGPGRRGSAGLGLRFLNSARVGKAAGEARIMDLDDMALET